MADNKKVEKASRAGNNPILPSRNTVPPSLNPQPGRGAHVMRAAAISYNPGEDDAPVLAAFGEGLVAEKIVEVAKESGVPVLPDPSLASMLSKISVGDEIPEELYEAVARVLVFVSEIDRSYGEKVRKNV